MRRRSLLVRRAALVAFISLSVAAGCDSPTRPAARRSVIPAAGAPRDVILGDTLSCLSGWQVINGYYVCN